MHAEPFAPQAWSESPAWHPWALQHPELQPVHVTAPQPWLSQLCVVFVQSMHARPPLPHAVSSMPPTHWPDALQQPPRQFAEVHPASPDVPAESVAPPESPAAAPSPPEL
jgi:hypothetical protein